MTRKPKVKLTLRRETLRSLGEQELKHAAGCAAAAPRFDTGQIQCPGLPLGTETALTCVGC